MAVDLDAFVSHADALNQHPRETCTTPCPKAPSRWLSHDQCTPCPIVLTSEGAGAGGLRWLVGATIACSLTRAICASHSGARGGPCYDPARLVVVEVAAQVDQYPDSARFSHALHQPDKGCRYRQRAGLHDALPGADDLRHVRDRVGAEAIEMTLASVGGLWNTFGLIKGARLSTDGQLEPSYSRSQGCTDACEGCRSFPGDESGRQELGHQRHSGATRLQLTCPFPAVVDKVHKATATKGNPVPPQGTLRALDNAPQAQASHPDRHQVATLLGLSEAKGPHLRLPWCHVSPGPQGALWASCPKGPSDLEATIGDHVDTKNPAQNAPVFGSRHQRTTDITRTLGLEWPLGNSTSPADAHEGSQCMAHRAALAMPVLPAPVPLGDSAYDVTVNDHWSHDRGGLAVFQDHPRNAPLDPESLVKRGDDPHGTPSAPCGRLCHSKGDDSHAESRQSGCGRPCSRNEQEGCPHAQKPWGSRHSMAFHVHPRLIGPIPRGSSAWQRLSAARTASERTNSDDQEVIANGRPLRMRGLKAFRFAGALRTLAQRRRRALHCVLDVNYTLGKTRLSQTCKRRLFDN